MKKNILSAFVSFALIGFAGFAHAEDAKTTSAPAQKGGMAEHGMMGEKMDMEKMHSMMNDCMQMHKDGKMCEGQAMEQCQKGMDKKDCMKMMKKTKHTKK